MPVYDRDAEDQEAFERQERERRKREREEQIKQALNRGHLNSNPVATGIAKYFRGEKK